MLLGLEICINLAENILSSTFLMANENKIYRLWKPISYDEIWENCDTSILDDISSSWLSRRAVLQENSSEYAEFLNQKKREHAIETGVIERIYDLSKGVTETFIKEGFVESYLSHGDTDIPKRDLMNHLKDHIEAVDFIFDVVNENRPLTTGFIKELHHLTTRHQKHAEGRDQFGNKSKIALLKGAFKIRENNPTRSDGTVIHFCPPEQVDSEMDNLIEIYNDLIENEKHPLKIATWLHHAFVSIHPFQDGNGRVARLLTSLVFIKFGFFPFTVLREEMKVKYIDALEEADEGKPQKLVSYFAQTQKRNIEKALNIGEVAATSLEEIESIFAKKLEESNVKGNQKSDLELKDFRNFLFEYYYQQLFDFKERLNKKINGSSEISIETFPFRTISEGSLESHNEFAIEDYSEKYTYHFNSNLPIAWLILKLEVPKVKKIYTLISSLHHYGYSSDAIAIGNAIEVSNIVDNEYITLFVHKPDSLPPHVISTIDDFESKKKNIKIYLENALTLFLAEIANDL